VGECAERAGAIKIVPIPGRKREHWLEQNVKALDMTLDEQAMNDLDQLGDQVVGARY